MILGSGDIYEGELVNGKKEGKGGRLLMRNNNIKESYTIKMENTMKGHSKTIFGKEKVRISAIKVLKEKRNVLFRRRRVQKRGKEQI